MLYTGSSSVSNKKFVFVDEPKKLPVARVTLCGAIGTSVNVRLFTTFPEASFMFIVTLTF